MGWLWYTVPVLSMSPQRCREAVSAARIRQARYLVLANVRIAAPGRSVCGHGSPFVTSLITSSTNRSISSRPAGKALDPPIEVGGVRQPLAPDNADRQGVMGIPDVAPERANAQEQ